MAALRHWSTREALDMHCSRLAGAHPHALHGEQGLEDEGVPGWVPPQLPQPRQLVLSCQPLQA